jgi:hypothetical protein
MQLCFACMPYILLWKEFHHDPIFLSQNMDLVSAFFFLICMNEGVSQYAGSTNNPISLLSLILQLYSHLIKYLIRPSKSFHVTKLVLSGSLCMSLSFESRKDIIGSFSLISKKLILGPKKCAKVVRSF